MHAQKRVTQKRVTQGHTKSARVGKKHHDAGQRDGRRGSVGRQAFFVGRAKALRGYAVPAKKTPQLVLPPSLVAAYALPRTAALAERALRRLRRTPPNGGRALRRLTPDAAARRPAAPVA